MSRQPSMTGTTFHVYLPAAAGRGRRGAAVGLRCRGTDGTARATFVTGARKPCCSWRTIRSSATFIAGALRAHGYTVLEAGNAEEALEIVRTNQAPIHLLLTDVVMPGMNGRELSELVVGMRCDDARALHVGLFRRCGAPARDRNGQRPLPSEAVFDRRAHDEDSGNVGGGLRALRFHTGTYTYTASSPVRMR